MATRRFDVVLTGCDAAGEYCITFKVLAPDAVEVEILARAAAALQDIAVATVASVDDLGPSPFEADGIRRVAGRTGKTYAGA